MIGLGSDKNVNIRNVQNRNVQNHDNDKNENVQNLTQDTPRGQVSSLSRRIHWSR